MPRRREAQMGCTLVQILQQWKNNDIHFPHDIFVYLGKHNIPTS